MLLVWKGGDCEIGFSNCTCFGCCCYSLVYEEVVQEESARLDAGNNESLG
jgi:hypothetical protein